MKQFRFIFLLFTIFSIVNSCKNESEIDSIAIKNGKKLELKYAEGFSITKYKTHSVLIINSPWPNSKETFKYILAQNNISGQSEVFKANIKTPIENIVVTSTTHIPSLELLRVETSLVGFPGLNYISSENTRKRITNGEVGELGKNEVINTEVLLELQPDAIIGFGVDGVNKSFETIKKVIIVPEFTIENAMMTPTFKLKKNIILKKYEHEIDTMYQ